ncbi:hypothetical protein [Methylobacterium pseudosasicola]|uniref:Uncharacterized protein n=1 Tax=Methylobacterium pseudosasicola TaxID=582667 RepID=A0A1I4IZB4_9HYPH|nr:hypothetical protein [Methylobacterium pseudosasicola]SFL59664.1 hypothetical protein SAMN05192568_100750 [Methylobacterium pseudosasicola]
MIRALIVLPLATLLIVPAAEARSARVHAKPLPNPAIKARESALKDFDARMSRLDALMGLSSKASPRSRSADAGR